MYRKSEIIFKALAGDERNVVPFVDSKIVANLISKLWPNVIGNDDVLELAAEVQTLCAKAG